MPKVRPLTKEQKDRLYWQKAAENLSKQINDLKWKSKLTKSQIARKMGLSTPTLYAKLSNPANMKKSEERRLAEIFEEYGLKYDFTMGEGGAA